MTIAVVNGFQCRDCADVGYAIKRIDPVHPGDGPDGIYAPPPHQPEPAEDVVVFGGALAGLLSRMPGEDAATIGVGGGRAGPDRTPLDTFA